MLLKEKSKILLLEIVEDTRVAMRFKLDSLDSTQDVRLKGLVPHKVYNHNGEVVVSYDYKKEFVDILPLAEYKGCQLVAAILTKENANEYQWAYWDIGEQIFKHDDRNILPTMGTMTICNEEESKHIDSIFPNYMKTSNEILENSFEKKQMVKKQIEELKTK